MKKAAGTIAFALVLQLLLSAAPGTAEARRGDDDSRNEFYGIIKERPKGKMQGTWVIGGRTFKTEAGTEFDETEGQLAVGSCAKVEIRNDRVHEIDSEPARDCR